MLHNIGEWVEHLSFAVYFATTAKAYATVSMIHYFTLFVLVGTSALVDLRVMGLAGTRKPLTAFAEQIFPWMWGAFWLAMISGFLMVSGDAGDFFPDMVFKIKVVMIVLAIIFVVLVQRGVPKWGALPEIPTSGKVLAFLSLFFWLASILAGVEIASISGLG